MGLFEKLCVGIRRVHCMISVTKIEQNILPETLRNVKNAWVQKLQLCVANNGGHFEHNIFKTM